MNVQQNVSLKEHSTMRLGGNARYFGEAHSTQELTEYLTWADRINIPSIVIGTGSNIVWQDGGYEGMVIVNKIMGFTIRQIGGTEFTMFTFGAGESWDEAVRKTVEMGYTGLESLSLIPGTAGAAPVQNIGAYGAEIKDTLISVRAYDKQAHDFVTLTNEQCKFGYRSSVFNGPEKGRYIIASMTVKLGKTPPQPPFYASVQSYLDKYSIRIFTPLIVRNAVIAIRTDKLPDPKIVANNGSFFGNPIIKKVDFEPLAKTYNDIPNWPMPNDEIKLSAAWLVEQAGFQRGFKDSETGLSLWKNQALVIVNDNAKSTADLMLFKQKIVNAVKAKFQITLKQEPELI